MLGQISELRPFDLDFFVHGMHGYCAKELLKSGKIVILRKSPLLHTASTSFWRLYNWQTTIIFC
jgi:hypothetical protein